MMDINDLELVEYPHFDSWVPPLIQQGYKEDRSKAWLRQMRYRKKLVNLAAYDEYYQHVYMAMCREDSLFWLSSFCYVYEPRPHPRILPFVLWDHQLPAWMEMEKWLGHCDVGLEKSRGEGASWMICMLLLHRWLFTPMFSAGLVSKDERSCDDPDNPDSLFWKIDWQLTRLPKWMVPSFNRVKNTHMLKNNENHSTLSGFAATGDVASGGRKTVFVMDELAKFPRGPDKEAMDSTQHVTDCRYLISTPKGSDGAYFQAMHQDSSLKKVILDWKQNPIRNEGLYHVDIGRDNSRTVVLDDRVYWLKLARSRGHGWAADSDLEELAGRIVDETNKNPFGYEFMITGPYVKHGWARSPWYDNECGRAGATPAGIAQELDRDYGGSASRYFDINLLERLQQSCNPPMSVGELAMPVHCDSHQELQRIKFKEFYGGRLQLWFTPDLHGRAPKSRNYIIGGDVAAGGGGVKSSNSALFILDRTIGRQVGMFASPNISPADLADYAVALGYYFEGAVGPALVIWESNGPPGIQFTQRIKQLEYPNVYYRGSTEEVFEKETKKLGFHTNLKSKPAAFGEFSRAIAVGDCEILSHVTLEEAKGYQNMPGGKIEHIAASSEEDPAGAGERHGDRVIAAVLAWWVAKDYMRSGDAADAAAVEAPPNSFLGRRARAQKESQAERMWRPRSERRRSNVFRR